MDLADVVRQAARRHHQEEVKKGANSQTPSNNNNSDPSEPAGGPAKDKHGQGHQNAAGAAAVSAGGAGHVSSPARAHHPKKKQQRPSNLFTTEAFDDDSETQDSARDRQSSERSADQHGGGSAGGYFESQQHNIMSSASNRMPQTPMRGPFFLTEVERGSEKMKSTTSGSQHRGVKTPPGPSRQSSRSRVPSLDQQPPLTSAGSTTFGDRLPDSAASSRRTSIDHGGLSSAAAAAGAQEATIQEEPAEMDQSQNPHETDGPSPSQSITSRFLRRRSSTGMMSNSKGTATRRNSGGAASGTSHQLLPTPSSPVHQTSFFSRSGRVAEEQDETGSRTPQTGHDGGELQGTRSIDDHQSRGHKPSKGWQVLRNRVKADEQIHRKQPGKEIQKGLSGTNMLTELTCGHLPVMMLKMAMDRDEHNVPRVPVLLNYLKLRITDSIYPFSNAHAIFRIELEYGDGLLKWVIYRELRDFVNLHTHYRVAGIKNSTDLPSFPKTSIPYLNVLRREKGGSKDISKSEFARSQRQNLETYLLKLVRAFMFRPEANRLAKFLEISAASISFAARGGATGKQGYIKMSSPNNLSRKTQSSMVPQLLHRRAEPKWVIVRESYLIAVSDPGSTEVWEVFLFDSDFHAERPRRLYRQGYNTFKTAISPEDVESDQEEDDAVDAFEAGEKSDSKGKLPLKKAKQLINKRNKNDKPPAFGDPHDPSTTDIAANNPEEMMSTSQHTFYLVNSESKLKMTAKSERQMDQFIASIERMAQRSPWAGRNRFDSFAPIRQNVSAKWLADGRDYYWELSRAVSLAKKVIYIHDWWLSPELYLRRPPALNQQWRLDRLLQRKAQEGVKIYVIIYKEVAQSFTPVDSQYTKNRLTELHHNIMVQRSPDSEARNLLWSHHEKLCVVDETIVFMGGFDLCFGRWDTPQHSLVDDRPKGFEDIEEAFTNGVKGDVEDYQIWPGKDYSNQRVSDFFILNRPQDDMYDRNVTPRQPWHDFGVQLVGQPARDMSRHFIQRWNHLLRIKHHSRVMPFLIPPADFTAAELKKNRLQGTCETQLLRSAGPWSLGTPKRIEHSIQNAYIKAIQLSEAFVYIENQYFSSSTVAENVVIENKIGDALVSRIKRAHAEGMPWRACIIIPLTPGYPMPLDSPDAAAVRMIMEAQARSIYRGEHSLFSRLRRDGIDPEKYINFFSLRAWGKLNNGCMTSQDVYIHDKIMIVDDRLAIIGSANINERSQRGDRDSEVAVIIRDTDMIESTMAGLPFQVGRFAHTMRVHLMQEHLGVDTDALAARGGPQVAKATGTSAPIYNEEPWDPEGEQESGKEKPFESRGPTDAYASGKGAVFESAKEMVEGMGQAAAGGLAHVGRNNVEKVPDVGGKADTQSKLERGDVEMDATRPGPTVEERLTNEHPPHLDHSMPDYDSKTETRKGSGSSKPKPLHLSKLNGNENGMNEDKTEDPAFEDESEGEEDLAPNGMVNGDGPGKPPPAPSHLSVHRLRDADARRRPSFADSIASGSTMSDDQIPGRARSSSTASNKDNNFHFGSKKHRFSVSMQRSTTSQGLPSKPPTITPEMFEDPLDPDFYERTWLKAAVLNTEIFRKVFRCTPDDKCLTWLQFKQWDAWEKRHQKPPRDNSPRAPMDIGSPGLVPVSEKAPLDDPKPTPADTTTDPNNIANHGFTHKELEMFEKLLDNLRGNLVVFPTRFLESEAVAGNNLFARDRIQPMAVYD